MKLKLFFVSFLLAGFFALPVTAEEMKFPLMDKCIEKADGVQPEINDCLNTEFSRQDKRVKRAYDKAKSEIDTQRQKYLVASHQACVLYRDTYLDFLADPDGGQMGHTNSLWWLVKATALHAVELEEAIQ
jgi:uncharacterized protein YecT (DUF1311 family)